MTGQNLRELGAVKARKLRAGADHYRAFVGPPGRYDLIAASQFALLFLMGLREEHRLLDFGCGSLRLGRLAIPYLLPHRYCGVEPEAWLVDEGFAREIGDDARRVKKPRFDHNRDFRVDMFGERFDFIIAQSVFSHTGEAMAKAALNNFAQVLSPGGLVLTNWLVGPEEDGVHPCTSGWVYPGCVAYEEQRVHAVASQCGLASRLVPWPHPTQTWFAMAHDEALLPDAATLAAMDIKPLARPGKA